MKFKVAARSAIVCAVLIYGLFIPGQLGIVASAPSLSPDQQLSLALGDGLPSAADTSENWQNSLYTPTQLQFLDDKWFLVDCWHNRVLWSYELNLPIKQWGILDSDLASPHSVASDGTYYAVEDTGRNKLNFYRFENNKFLKVDSQVLGKIPHRTRYNDNTKSFYTVAADSSEIYEVAIENDQARIVSSHQIPTLTSTLPSHVRSFTIVGDEVWFTASGGQGQPRVIVTSNDGTFTFIRQYFPSEAFQNMNDLYTLQGKIIVTATPGAIGIVDSLDQLNTMRNLQSELQLKGTPYYISEVNGKLIIPEITEYSRIGIWNFTSGELKQEGILLDSGTASAESLVEKYRLQKL